MDKFLRKILQPSFEKLPGFSATDPSVFNAGNTELSLAQRKAVCNFGKERGIKKFEGDPKERCQYQECRKLLSVSNRYIYCRSCRKCYLEDLIERNPNQNPAEALAKLRRDQKSRKQTKRKRA